MSDDHEIEALSGAWRTISDDTSFSVPTALRRRRRQRFTFMLELLGCVVALASAIYFWLTDGGLVHYAAAALLTAVAVVCGVVSVKTRMRLGGWADWTPPGVLAFRLRECEVALSGARHGLVACGILAAFAGFVWLAAALEWDVLPPDFPRFYATVVGITVLLAGSWSLWRIRTKRRERTRLRTLLDELRDD
jgi:uncharacterized membrane protein YccC